MHTTHLLARGDETVFRKLGVWVSTDGLLASRSYLKRD